MILIIESYFWVKLISSVFTYVKTLNTPYEVMIRLTLKLFKINFHHIAMTRPRKNQPQITNSPFKQLRLNAELSQEQLARNIGVAISTIRRWEKGEAEPTMTVLQMKAFCQTFQTSLDQLPNSLLPNDSLS